MVEVKGSVDGGPEKILWRNLLICGHRVASKWTIYEAKENTFT